MEAGKRVRRGAAFGRAPLLPQAPSALPEGPRDSPGARHWAMQAAEGRRKQAMAAAGGVGAVVAGDVLLLLLAGLAGCW